MTGLLTINGKDAWTEFGAFLCETSADGRVNAAALLAVPQAKEITYVDFRERDGEGAPDDPQLKLQSIDRTLQLCVTASTEVQRTERYRSLIKLLTSGWLDISVTGFGTYRMVYKQMYGEPEWYKAYGSTCIVIFNVTLHEPRPTFKQSSNGV